MRIAAILACVLVPLSVLGQTPDAPAPKRDMVAPWSVNFFISQRYINAPTHFADPTPGMAYGRVVGSNHTFDNMISASLTESLAHNRVFWSIGYGASVETANQLATFTVGFRAFEFGRRR